MATTSLSLTQMVDLALGTPEVGAVNFNVLHTLMHAVISKLNIGDYKADINEADRELLSPRPMPIPEDGEAPSEVDSALGSTVPGTTVSSAKDPKARTSYPVPYHALEQKVSDLQQQMQELNNLPSNKELFERAKADTEKPRPVSDMWQNMQLTKRVDANESGVNKLMSLVEDLMGEMQRIRDQNEDLQKQLKKALEEASKANKFNELNDKLNQYPDPDTFSDFVTWSGLEDALKGIKENMDSLQTVPERVVIEMSSQTEPGSRPASSRSRASTPGPSPQLQELLEKLGKLTDQHDVLEEHVKSVGEELKNKLDKGALDGLGVSQELLDQLKELQDQLETLKKGREKDSDNLTRMQQAILQLQAELERISNTTQQLIDDSSNHKKDIQNLYGICNKLDETKADKEYVQSEVEVKADKRHLDGKVNRSLFDSTADELNKMINDILSKLLGHEDEWKKALNQLSDDLDGKLDRLEFGPIKDELERQLKALLKKLKNLNFDSYFEDDEAAGIRKQLLQKFNCISCDRPVDMAPQGPIPSIPATNGMPASRSTRPHTTFELDTIRQHAKSLYKYPYVPAPQTQVDIMDLYATQRACGGSHTMTYPNKRTTRLTHMNTLFREDEEGFPMFKEEGDIQGADGHVYKGRKQDGTLPNIPQAKSPNVPRKAPHPPATHQSLDAESTTKKSTGNHSARPASTRGSHPVSGVGRGSRPTSTAGGREIPTTEVPTGRDFVPPPAPAPSEPDPVDLAREPSPLLVQQTTEQVA